MDLPHLWGGGTRRPDPQPVPQLLQEQQRQRDGRHPGALQGHPDVAGSGERHLQVRTETTGYREVSLCIFEIYTNLYETMTLEYAGQAGSRRRSEKTTEEDQNRSSGAAKNLQFGTTAR